MPARERAADDPPIALTNTHALGTVRDAMVAWEGRAHTDAGTYCCMPVVGETFDGLLNDIWGGHVRPEHVWAALDGAGTDPVPQGNVGEGTGMVCHGFNGGIGTSSRVVKAGAQAHAVGTLVQANHGRRQALRVLGLPVGRVLGGTRVPLPGAAPSPGSGSIVAVLATNAPLLPGQCARLAPGARGWAWPARAGAPRIPSATFSSASRPATPACRWPATAGRSTARGASSWSRPTR